MVKITKKDILQLFNLLNGRLKKEDTNSELHVVGGAVMCLALDARASTMDVDGLFIPSAIVRRLAKQVGRDFGIDENWLNDGVKGFFSDKGKFNDFLELSNLTVYTATPEYLLAMKCLAMRIGEEFHDIADIQYLLRYLNIENYQQAKEIIKQYYPIERFPQKTLYALEEMLEEKELK
ncbi:MAG: DUF6036 family nucleotidyltransferase [Proteobacteria bacterium]|nr:DUF6036 family nucleotidyltransferase [Pseudomonadota bacterium]